MMYDKGSYARAQVAEAASTGAMCRSADPQSQVAGSRPAKSGRRSAALVHSVFLSISCTECSLRWYTSWHDGHASHVQSKCSDISPAVALANSGVPSTADLYAAAITKSAVSASTATHLCLLLARYTHLPSVSTKNSPLSGFHADEAQVRLSSASCASLLRRSRATRIRALCDLTTRKSNFLEQSEKALDALRIAPTQVLPACASASPIRSITSCVTLHETPDLLACARLHKRATSSPWAASSENGSGRTTAPV